MVNHNAVLRLVTIRQVTIILYLVLGITSQAAQAANLYVDNTLKRDITNGKYSVKKRNAKGKAGNAYTTIKAAFEVMQAGDTLYLRGGTYHENQLSMVNWRAGSAKKWYTVKSFPSEWAIIDGQHKPSGTWNHAIFYGTTQTNQNNYIRFEHLEITGAGHALDHPQYPSSSGSGISMRGRHLQFRYLYIHDNYGNASNNQAGLQIGISGNVLIEYCYFRANGEIRKDNRTTSVANALIFADYAYAKPVDFRRASVRNIIRYNLFSAGDTGGTNYTVTGFKQKGMQRLTGYVYRDKKNPADNKPNDASGEPYGDQIHHNIFLNHPVGIEVDQDYAQIHHNIILGKKWDFAAANGIQGRDENSERRGPFKLCVYNNTVIANGIRGIIHHPVPQGWLGVTPYIKCWIQNNIIEDAAEGYDWAPISIESDSVKDSGGWPLKELRVDRNYFYRSTSKNLVYIDTTKYTQKSIVAAGAADVIYANLETKKDPLFRSGTDANQLKTIGAHKLTEAVTIATGGIGGKHPYLKNITMPSYVGATNPKKDSGEKWNPAKPDPEDTGWVNHVRSLSEVRRLVEKKSWKSH